MQQSNNLFIGADESDEEKAAVSCQTSTDVLANG